MARPRSPQTSAALDRMAELISGEVPVQKAGAELGYSRCGSQGLFLKMRQRLGWQAQ